MSACKGRSRPGPDRAPGKRPLQRSIQPVRDGGGDTTGNVVVYRDVSGEAELERMAAEVRRRQPQSTTRIVRCGNRDDQAVSSVAGAPLARALITYFLATSTPAARDLTA